MVMYGLAFCSEFAALAHEGQKKLVTEMNHCLPELEFHTSALLAIAMLYMIFTIWSAQCITHTVLGIIT